MPSSQLMMGKFMMTRDTVAFKRKSRLYCNEMRQQVKRGKTKLCMALLWMCRASSSPSFCLFVLLDIFSLVFVPSFLLLLSCSISHASFIIILRYEMSARTAMIDAHSQK